VESAQAFFEFRGSKEGSRGFTVAINQGRVEGSCITGSKIDAEDHQK
jgi:hypothetical protein